jgi:hypothetical protein
VHAADVHLGNKGNRVSIAFNAKADAGIHSDSDEPAMAPHDMAFVLPSAHTCSADVAHANEESDDFDDDDDEDQVNDSQDDYDDWGE